jgi:acetyl-CoA acetyltransferase
MPEALREVAVAGIGWTEFSRNSGRSELRLALDAITGALNDAGLSPREVDGYVTFDSDSNKPAEVAASLGVDNLGFWSTTYPGGAGSGATIAHATMAIATGRAEVVVCLRALNERSGRRFGQSRAGSRVGGVSAFYNPYGLLTPAQYAAVRGRRYMHEYGATSNHLGLVSVAFRKHAQRNPNAQFYGKPITLADHQASRMIADPLRLLDCCLETDGACALVLTPLARARDLKQPPVKVLATAQGSGPAAGIDGLGHFNSPRLSQTPWSRAVGDALFRRAGVTVRDLDVAQIYDHFTPLVLIALEELGFCGRGEAGPWLENGRIEWPDGEIPVNTSGGLLSEGYIHGLNLFVEAARQVRGTSTCQVAGAEVSLAIAGNLSATTSGVIFAKG